MLLVTLHSDWRGAIFRTLMPVPVLLRRCASTARREASQTSALTGKASRLICYTNILHNFEKYYKILTLHIYRFLHDLISCHNGTCVRLERSLGDNHVGELLGDVHI